MVLLHSGGSIQILLHLFGRFLVVEHIYTYRKSSNKPPEAYLQNFLGGGLFEGGGGLFQSLVFSSKVDIKMI